MSRVVTRGARRAAHVLGFFQPCPDAMNAAWRAALVARELGVPMRLLHHGAQHGGEMPAGTLASFIADVEERLGLRVEPVAARPDSLAECMVGAAGILLVVASPRRRGLRERLRSLLAERLARAARRSGVPVLRVRQPARGPYQQVLVPVDLEAGSAPLVAAAARLSPGARMAVFHAVAPTAEVLLRELEAPPAAWRAHRDERERSARARLERVIASARDGGPASADAASMAASVGFAAPARGVLAAEAECGADLVVVGRRRGLLAGRLPGSVTRQVVAHSRADVLVWPLEPEAATAPRPAPAPPRASQPSWSFLPRRAAKG